MTIEVKFGIKVPKALLIGGLSNPTGLIEDAVTEDTVIVGTEAATVKDWRMARDEVLYRDDIDSLLLFKAATVLLEEADRHGFDDSDVLLKRRRQAGPAAIN
jgi:hypothetical protein